MKVALALFWNLQHVDLYYSWLCCCMLKLLKAWL